MPRAKTKPAAADLFGGTLPKTPSASLEVHEHVFIRGPRARFAGTDDNRIRHSHEGGDVPHQHPETGPASYTIDKDQWFAATGLNGGSRKEFTKKPAGEQLPIVELADWQKSFNVYIGPPPKDFRGTGAGPAPIARMVLGARMRPVFQGDDE